jgi:glycosyltransferase involved in cell wall biosynthesis
MRLLIYSHFFAPSVGGVETLALSLARGLAGLSTPNGEPEFEITLATHTPADNFEDESLPFRVVRQPNFIHLWDLIRASDVVHVAGPALAPMILGLLARRPVVVEHHGFQTICPNGQLLIEPAGRPCPGHFMAGRYGERLVGFAQALAADLRAPFPVPSRFEQHYSDRVAWWPGATSTSGGDSSRIGIHSRASGVSRVGFTPACNDVSRPAGYY